MERVTGPVIDPQTGSAYKRKSVLNPGESAVLPTGSGPRLVTRLPNGLYRIQGPEENGVRAQIDVPANQVATSKIDRKPNANEYIAANKAAGQGFRPLTLASGQKVMVLENKFDGGYFVRSDKGLQRHASLASIKTSPLYGGRTGDDQRWARKTLSDGQPALVARNAKGEWIATTDIDTKGRPAPNAVFRTFAKETSESKILASTLLASGTLVAPTAEVALNQAKTQLLKAMAAYRQDPSEANSLKLARLAGRTQSLLPRYGNDGKLAGDVKILLAAAQDYTGGNRRLGERVLAAIPMGEGEANPNPLARIGQVLASGATNVAKISSNAAISALSLASEADAARTQVPLKALFGERNVDALRARIGLLSMQQENDARAAHIRQAHEVVDSSAQAAAGFFGVKKNSPEAQTGQYLAYGYLAGRVAASFQSEEQLAESVFAKARQTLGEFNGTSKTVLKGPKVLKGTVEKPVPAWQEAERRANVTLKWTERRLNRWRDTTLEARKAARAAKFEKRVEPFKKTAERVLLPVKEGVARAQSVIKPASLRLADFVKTTDAPLIRTGREVQATFGNIFGTGSEIVNFAKLPLSARTVAPVKNTINLGGAVLNAGKAVVEPITYRLILGAKVGGSLTALTGAAVFTNAAAHHRLNKDVFVSAKPQSDRQETLSKFLNMPNDAKETVFSVGEANDVSTNLGVFWKASCSSFKGATRPGERGIAIAYNVGSSGVGERRTESATFCGMAGIAANVGTRNAGVSFGLNNMAGRTTTPLIERGIEKGSIKSQIETQTGLLTSNIGLDVRLGPVKAGIGAYVTIGDFAVQAGTGGIKASGEWINPRPYVSISSNATYDPKANPIQQFSDLARPATVAVSRTFDPVTSRLGFLTLPNFDKLFGPAGQKQTSARK